MDISSSYVSTGATRHNRRCGVELKGGELDSGATPVTDDQFSRHISLLQDMPVFGGTSEDTLRLLLSLAPIVEVKRGDYFFRQGEPGESMFVLEQGRVAVLKGWNGHNYLLRKLSDGDCFGEMALMDLHPRSASVIALDLCRAIEVDTRALQAVHQHNLEQFALIQMNMGREVSRRLRDANERLFRHRMEVEIRRDDGDVVHPV